MVADAFIMLLELLAHDKLTAKQLSERLEELLAHDKLTAKQLSERLEVSERTVYRYIDVLSASGVPVVSNKGKGGGISIGSDFRLTSALFDKAELQYIVTAIEAFSSPTAFRDKVLLKLNSMRPSASTSGFASEDFAVDFSDAPQGGAFGAKLDALSAAKKARKAVEICYHNRRGDVSERVAVPPRGRDAHVQAVARHAHRADKFGLCDTAAIRTQLGPRRPHQKAKDTRRAACRRKGALRRRGMARARERTQDRKGLYRARRRV